MSSRKAFSTVLAFMAALFIFAASPASAASIQARGSGGGGGRAVSAPSNSGGSKSYSPPRSGISGGGGTTGGRGVLAPSNSGGRAAPLSSRTVIVNPPSSRVSVPSTARASGSSYSSGGHTWNYSQASYHNYYTTYHGGYPLFGSAAYWTLYDSPYYAPNYLLAGNPWFHHSYPGGYVLQNGEIVPVSSNTSLGSSIMSTVMWIGAVIIGVFLILVLIGYFGNRRNRSNYGRGI